MPSFDVDCKYSMLIVMASEDLLLSIGDGLSA
jgi:hypothetical protein